MGREIKVFVDSPHPDVLRDPVIGFPFSHLGNVVPCESPNEADHIFAPFRTQFSTHVNERGREVMASNRFKKWGEKYVFFTIADNPEFDYEAKPGIKFLASPLWDHGSNENASMNVVQVPLWLGGPAWDIQQDREFIEELRSAPKTHDFIFLGDMAVRGKRDRQWLARVAVRSFKFEHRPPCIWNPGFGEKMREFLREVSRARYCFAPRGVGSSSARLYEAMLAGTVPIVDNSLDMPLWRGVHSCKGVVNAPEKASFQYHTLPLIGPAYWQKREAAMHYWDHYCYLPNCALEIETQHL